jgi:hypothetical protein
MAPSSMELMALWTSTESALSMEHLDDCDEYMEMVRSCYTLFSEGKRMAGSR